MILIDDGRDITFLTIQEIEDRFELIIRNQNRLEMK